MFTSFLKRSKVAFLGIFIAFHFDLFIFFSKSYRPISIFGERVARSHRSLVSRARGHAARGGHDGVLEDSARSRNVWRELLWNQEQERHRLVAWRWRARSEYLRKRWQVSLVLDKPNKSRIFMAFKSIWCIYLNSTSIKIKGTTAVLGLLENFHLIFRVRQSILFRSPEYADILIGLHANLLYSGNLVSPEWG